MANALLQWFPSMHRARVPQALTLVVSMAACSPTPPAVPDGGAAGVDGSVEGDGSVDEPPTRGIVLRFVADPALPASLEDGEVAVVIESVELRLEDLRVIGDAAPGDERTRIDWLRLGWPAGDGGGRDDGHDGEWDGDGDGTGDGAGTGDVEIEYADAPPGIYSLFRASVVGFDIDGEARGGEVDYEFDVDRDSGQPLAIEIELGSAALEPGGIIELTARFDARQAVAGVPWDELSAGDDGEVEIDSEDAVMGDIEAALVGSFSLAELD